MDTFLYSKEKIDILHIQDKLIEIDLCNWKYEVQSKSKLTNILFNSQTEAAQYVLSFLQKVCRFVFAILRWIKLPFRNHAGMM